MRFKATQGKPRIGTGVEDATYLEAARWGRHLRPGNVRALRATDTDLHRDPDDHGALSVLVAISVFLAIAYKVFKRNEASEPVSQRYRKGRR